MPPGPDSPRCECTDVPSLVSTTLHLLSAFCASGCPRLAIMVNRHLEKLANHPDTDPLVRGTSVKLMEQYWEATETAARAMLRREHAESGPTTQTAPKLKLVH